MLLKVSQFAHPRSSRARSGDDFVAMPLASLIRNDALAHPS
jgi:hypothetical protein